MSSDQIGPGDCYEAAFHFVMDKNVFSGDDDDKGYVLVHGIPTGTGGGIVGLKFGHAWIEYGVDVIDPSNGKIVILPKLLYYEIGKIDPKECKRYTWPEARRRALDKGHYGGWDTNPPR